MKINPIAPQATAETSPAPRVPPQEAAALPVDRAEIGGTSRRSSGTEVIPLTSGAQVASSAAAVMQEARTGIRLEVYRLGHDKLVDVLCDQARKGIDVQVLLDPSVYDEEHRKRRDAIVDHMRTSGVDVGFYPIAEKERRIDHVKLLIVDNRYALVAGMNWDQHSPENTDQGIMLSGPAVGDVNAVFENDWKIAGGTPKPLPPPPPLPEKPLPVDGKLPVDRDATVTVATTEGEKSGQDLRKMVVDRLNGAKKSIYLEAFALADKEVLEALTSAAGRGVDVRVLLDPNKPIVYQNHKSADLLKQAGVKVRWLDVDIEKEEKDHSKMVIVDDEATILGSANFTYAGLSVNHEASAEVISKAVGAAFSDLFLSRWEQRSVEKAPSLPDYQERVPEEPASEQYAREVFRDFTDYFHAGTRRNFVGKRKEAILAAVEENRGNKDLRFSAGDAEETTIGKLTAFLEARGLTAVRPEPGTREALWKVRLGMSRESAPEVGRRAPERLAALASAVGDASLREAVAGAQAAAPRGYAGAPADYRPDGFPADSLRPDDLDYRPGKTEPYPGGGRILADRRAQVAARHLAEFYGLSARETDEVLGALAVRNLALGVSAEAMREAKDTRAVDWKPWVADPERKAAGVLLEKVGGAAAATLRELVERSLEGPPPAEDRRHLVLYLATRLTEAPNFYGPAD